MPVTPVRYFATAFFSPFYFAPLAATIPSDPTGIGVLPYGDKEAFEAIISILNSTGVFADVLFGITPEQRTTPADVAPLALIQPQYWNEFDDADPNVLIRQVSYSLTLIVRDDDPFTRYAQLEGLTALAQDSLNNRSSDHFAQRGPQFELESSRAVRSARRRIRVHDSINDKPCKLMQRKGVLR